MAFPVKWFSYVRHGDAPYLDHGYGTNAAQKGKLVNVFKTCLFDGFNVTALLPENVTYDSGTNTVRIEIVLDRVTDPAAVHGFTVFQVIEVSGADQAEYNGEHRITRVGWNWIEFEPESAPAATPATTATTIEVKAAPVGGWTLVDIDAVNDPPQKMAIRSGDPDAAPYTWVIDNSLLGDASRRNFYARFLCIPTAEYVDLDTHVDENSPGYTFYLHIPASHYYGSSDYYLVADSKMIYWLPRFARHNRRSGFVIGDYNSVIPGDEDNVIGLGGPHSTANNYWQNTGGYDTYSEIQQCNSERYKFTPTSRDPSVDIYGKFYMPGFGTRNASNLTTPALPINGEAIVSAMPFMLKDKDSGGFIGTMPGWLQCLQASTTYNLTIRDDLDGFEGAPVLFIDATYSYRADYGTVQGAIRLDDWRS